MSSDTFAPEGNLPNRSTHKKFYALRRLPVRGYCWESTNTKNTYFISHYVNKTWQKLRDQDTNKVHSNWHRIEIDGYEC